MFAFNSFSHGTQDLYPTFLTRESARAADGELDCHRLQRRGAAGRNRIWDMVGTDWAAAGDCDRGAAGDSGDSAVGVFAHRADAGAGRVSDAVYGAGRVGSDSGASERISPPAVRGTLPGFAYQMGNFFSSRNSVIQAKLAESAMEAISRRCWPGPWCWWPAWWQWSPGAAGNGAGPTCRTRNSGTNRYSRGVQDLAHCGAWHEGSIVSGRFLCYG